MLVVFLMGFFSGLPLLLVGGTLKVWLTESGLNLTTVGAFSLVGLPYSWKFLWSPLMDRFAPLRLGRRRALLAASQLALALGLLFLSTLHPSNQLSLIIAAAVFVAFCSASQDIVIDAYRREILPDQELGLGSSLAVLGYRLGLLVAAAGAFSLAQEFSWVSSYRIMAAIAASGLVVTYFASEPKVDLIPPQSLYDSVIGPLKEFFKRDGAWLILAFILFYKIGESMASDMLNPFYIKIGFTKNEIATIAKVFGIWSAILGGVVGGALMLRLRIYRSLWLFGILQSLALLLFAVLAQAGHNLTLLAIAIAAESFTSGMATSAYVAFMASQTNKRFTATQYALLTSLMSMPRIFLGATTGFLAQSLGWPVFFISCAIFTIPGLLILFRVKPLIQEAR
jgi:PAT family beta-lactamase induction signal transducer AmpG